jgi:hypothetical protein
MIWHGMVTDMIGITLIFTAGVSQFYFGRRLNPSTRNTRQSIS